MSDAGNASAEVGIGVARRDGKARIHRKKYRTANIVDKRCDFKDRREDREN